jgi:hypothetical protein
VTEIFSNYFDAMSEEQFHGLSSNVAGGSRDHRYFAYQTECEIDLRTSRHNRCPVSFVL